MINLTSLSAEEIKKLAEETESAYRDFCSMGLSLDMSRGNPSREQLSLSGDVLNAVTDPEDCISEEGFDCRNYGCPYGLKEARDLFSSFIGVPSENILIGGPSSLNLMYDTVSRAMSHGLAGSPKPWGREEQVKFICPVPGYDRHYKILEYYGIGMIPVSFTGEGPDMDAVEALVSSDASIKGIWCVPVYSNYTGDVYSAETIRRLASMNAKAPDFVVMYDNAYTIHDLYGIRADIPSFYEECIRAGHPERSVVFASTSKMTFAGGGISCVAFGPENLELAKKAMSIQAITHDKLNQLRHVRVLKDVDTMRARMDRFAEILKPKFETVIETFETKLGGFDVAEWSHPLGGYFICFRLLHGGARRVVSLCAEAGVKLTPAGAGFPYGSDGTDSFIRIAPSYPTTEELKAAATLLSVCALKVAIENINSLGG